LSVVPAPENRRKYRRIVFDGDARLYSDRAMWQAKLLDISLRGAMIARPDGWDGQRGKTQRLELRLAAGLIISVTATIARAGHNVIGYRFERMDFDSFIRLKRLIELNLGDAELLRHELVSL
jgi:hypothetical protein